MQFEPGTRVDRYVIEHLLGAGGMAEVYAVRHAVLGSPAALKILRIHAGPLVERMMREGRAQARLQHPNVVGVLDLIEVDGSPGLVMERVDGPTLAQILASGPLPPDRFDRFARGLLSGLAAAHELGIVHRDLKPANVLVARNDVVRIADFGLATVLADEPDPGLTRPGTALGTPAYMSPEQHEDAHQVDARSDLFSLGVVLYEMATGAAPAAGSNLIGAWQKMTQKRWPTPLEVSPTLSPNIDRAIQWALEPRPADRPQNVQALWSALFGEPLLLDPGATIVVDPPLATSVPPSSSAAVPKAARPLIGRAAEFGAAWDELDAHGTLVTLVGTGGSGKTRLAVELASRWGEKGRPVLCIDLQAARHETDLLQAVAWALDDGTEPSASMIGRSLARRGAILLTLDNVEQLPRTVAGLVSVFTRAAPSLRVLVTSRQPLGTAEEHLTDLAPLAVPDDPYEVLGSEAWRMFCAAASRASLGKLDPAQIQRILRALDGLPLAIELAAARLEVLDLDELERRLVDRFAVLADPASSGERHGGLYNAIAWSWSLLSAAEQHVLAQLSAFAAPFGLAAAEALIATSDRAVLDSLHGLVRRNMVRRSGSRFSLLGSIRDFADRQLTPEQRIAGWQKHAAWVGTKARARARGRIGEPAILRDLEDLAPELEAALTRAVDEPGVDGFDAGIALVFLYERRSTPAAVIRAVDRTLGLPDRPERAADRATVRNVRGIARRRSGDRDGALAEFTALLEEPLAADTRAAVIANIADLHTDRGEDEQAERLYREALALALVHGPGNVAASAAAALYTFCALRGEDEEAQRLRTTAYQKLPEGDRMAELEVRKLDGWLALVQERMDEAHEQYLRVAELGEDLRSLRTVAVASGQLGIIAEAQGRLEEADQRFAYAVERLQQLGDPVFVGYYDGFRGRVALSLGRQDDGEARLDRALAVDGMDPGLRALLVDVRATAWASRGEVARAAGAISEKHRAPVVSLAEAVAATARGDRSAAQVHLAAVRAALPAKDLHLNLLVTHLVAELERDVSAWRIAADGAWAETPTGERLAVGRHPANARILAHLAEVRASAPGVPVDVERLATAGWPGERIVAAAASNRVRVALSTLRREGLADLIERVEGGWRLRLDLAVRTDPTSS